MKQDERTKRETVQSVYVPARLDETTARMLQDLAAERHGGNKSAAIRAAIRETVERETVQAVRV